MNYPYRVWDEPTSVMALTGRSELRPYAGSDTFDPDGATPLDPNRWLDPAPSPRPEVEPEVERETNALTDEMLARFLRDDAVFARALAARILRREPTHQIARLVTQLV